MVFVFYRLKDMFFRASAGFLHESTYGFRPDTRSYEAETVTLEAASYSSKKDSIKYRSVGDRNSAGEIT
jgi:hypothetical protein